MTASASVSAPPVLVYEQWTVRHMVLTWDKVKWLWDTLQAYKTLFSDFVRGDYGNFFNLLTSRDTLWFEVWEGEEVVGLFWLSDLHLLTDANVHTMFFDRKPAEKTELTRRMLWWFFKNFPVNRVTAQPPGIYHATIRLMERLGFKHEGTKRGAILIGNKWNDQVIYGITRSEVERQWDS